MSKRKCISADEKMTRMLQLFHEKKEVFQLIELEKIAPKEMSISAQNVKDVIQALVDDGTVDTDKIGTSVYYWSFPGKDIHIKRKKIESQKQLLQDLNVKVQDIEKKVHHEQKIRISNGSDRDENLCKYEKLKQRKIELGQELQKLGQGERLENLQTESKKLLAAANRWTDNIYSIVSWCKDKFNIEEEKLNKQFNISELDYLT